MYAGTQVNWHEVLMPSMSTVNQSLPLFLCVFSSDKGPEKITDLEYDDFKKMYGVTPDFFKYGQPLLQAHQILRAGGRVMGKRLVAPDSTLAHTVIAAVVDRIEENKVDEDGHQIYIEEDGTETTTPSETTTEAKIYKAKVRYEAYHSDAGLKTMAEVENFAKSSIQTNSRYPLFVVCDNGRGKSIKNVRLSSDYISARKNNFMIYKISDYEGTTLVESQRFAVKPETLIRTSNGLQSLALIKSTCTQFDAMSVTSGWDAFITKLAEITGYTKDELYSFDILFAQTLKQRPISSIILDTTSENALTLDAEYGIPVLSDENANGSFGDAPFPGESATEAWAVEAVKFFNGTFSDEIYDLDQYKIDFCVDANYPYDLEDPSKDVKGAIANLAVFREDFYYLRDLGLDVASIDDVANIVGDRGWVQSPFIGDYQSSYDIIDPYSKQQVRVTMMHGMAPLLVNHFLTNIAAPLAGEFNNFVITEAVPDTLNIIPRVTPNYDQKQVLDDLNVNYVNYTADRFLTIQSTYTSQDHDGPLNFANNVLVTQRVIKAIREYCPKIRFMLMEAGNTDFAKYKTLIEDNIISTYASYFKSISLRYTADDEMTRSKIFNASLYCYYRDFPQGEIFDVFAIEGSPESNPIDQ